ALAVLGILIGVTAVIWLVAMGEGVSHQAQERIKELGATNIIIRSIKPPDSSSAAGSFFVRYGLLRDDLDRMQPEQIPTIKQVVPLRELRRQVLDRKSDRNEMMDVRVVGCTPKYIEMNHLHMDRGRFLT